MVRRLVQKKQGWLRKKDLGQFYAHVPTLRESLAKTLKFIGQEPQTSKHLFGLSRTGRRARALHLFDDTAAAVMLHYLGKIAESLLSGHLHTAGIGLFDAHDKLHYRGLPRPILPH